MIASALDVQGLYTFPNPLAKVPVGAMLQADNCVSQKDGILETRRGFFQAGTNLGGSPTRQFFSYQNRLLLNVSALASLFYDSTGDLDWRAFAGSYEAPTVSITTVPNWRMRGIEANKNFYISTSTGVQKLDQYFGPITLSGVPPGLNGRGQLAGGGAGFLGSNFQCAYQIVFGYTDANGNLLLGSPSERFLVVNSTGSADNTELVFNIPQGMTTNYFYQIYRTPQTAYSATPSENVPPGAEPQLAFQQQLTDLNISVGAIDTNDVTPDALLGAFLYTNPSQEGSFQTNDRPPFAYDMCTFSQMVFYANTFTLQSIVFNMISVGAPNGVQDGDTITVNSIVFTARTAPSAPREFSIVTSGTVADNIDATARNLVEIINANATATNVYAFYISGFNSLPGQIELQSTGFSVGQFFVTSSRGGAYSPILPASGNTFGSSNDVTPNGIYVSKVGQPEAVPSVNLIFVGGGDQPIYRVLPLRDRVIVLKSDGVFVITGSTPQTLTVTLLDSTIICICAETARLLNNSVYCFSNQGEVSITESGITIVSRAIEEDLLKKTTDPLLSANTYAISYESERLYILTFPTEAYCYNWITNAWTRWPIAIDSGIVNPFDNTLYVHRPTSDISTFFVSKERKTYTYADFKDDTFPVTISAIDSTGLVVQLAVAPQSTWLGYGLQQDTIGTAIIVDLDQSAQTLTLDINNSTNPGSALGFVAGAATIQVPIPTLLTLCPQTAGFPHFMKSWGRVNFWFNAGNFQQILAAFQTELTGYLSPTQPLYANSSSNFGFGPFGSGPYGGQFNFPQAIQTLPNGTENAMARWIMPSLSLSFPEARLSYLGTTLSYEIISDAAG